MGLIDSTVSGGSSGASLGPVGAVAGTGLGLLAGILGHNAEKKKQEANAMMRGAEIQASPWTKMAPQTQIEFASPLAGSLIGGATAGLGAAQGLSKAFGGASPWANMTAKNQGEALQNMGSFGQVNPNPGMNVYDLDANQLPNFTRG